MLGKKQVTHYNQIKVTFLRSIQIPCSQELRRWLHIVNKGSVKILKCHFVTTKASDLLLSFATSWEWNWQIVWWWFCPLGCKLIIAILHLANNLLLASAWSVSRRKHPKLLVQFRLALKKTSHVEG